MVAELRSRAQPSNEVHSESPNVISNLQQHLEHHRCLEYTSQLKMCLLGIPWLGGPPHFPVQ